MKSIWSTLYDVAHPGGFRLWIVEDDKVEVHDEDLVKLWILGGEMMSSASKCNLYDCQQLETSDFEPYQEIA